MFEHRNPGKNQKKGILIFSNADQGRVRF
jgi:hypothetical protein